MSLAQYCRRCQTVETRTRRFSRRPRSRAPSTPPGRWPIGDTVWDVQDARAAGIGCIGVETGGFSQHELSQTGALQVYRDVKEVLDQLHTSPLAVLLR